MGDAPRSKVGMVVRGGLLVLVGIALFDIPAAYLASKDFSPWLSLAAGLLTFPLLALVWHGLAERARKRTESKKPALTKGWERWLMRSAAVGVLVVGVLGLVAGPGRVWSAFRHHALWFVPERSSPLVADSKLFDHVPPDAGAVAWVRFDDEVRAAFGRVIPLTGDAAKIMNAPEIVIALKEDQFFLADRGDSGIMEVAKELLGMAQGLIQQYAKDGADLGITTGTTSDGAEYLVSATWKAQVGKGRPTTAIANMALAPDDAWIVVGINPATIPGAGDATAGAIWSRIHRGRLEVAGRFDTKSPEAAEKFVTQLRHELDKHRDECLMKYLHVDTGARGLTVTASVAIVIDEIEPAFRCR